MTLVNSLLIILALSYVFSFIARRFHSSDVIGLILAGLFLTLPFLESVTFGHELLIDKLSVAGLFALMFLAGFEVSWNLILKEEKHAIVITVATVISSLLIGTTVMLFLGFSLATSLIMGIAFGITAEAAKARSLLQLKKLKTKLGSLLMGTGIINDVIGMILFIGVLFFYADNFSLSEVFVLLGVLISFATGSLVHYWFDRFSKKIRILERFLLITLVPFFFVNMGLHFKEGLNHVNFTILIIVIITAALGQIAGVFITKPITKLRPKQLYLLGWGMNAKGAVELAIAHIALVVGLLPLSLYTSIVIMVLVTSVSFQLVMFHMVRKNPEIMN